MESLTALKRENVTSEELFEDEPMDTNETPFDAFCEEGEINSTDDEKTESVRERANIPNIFSRNYNKDQIGGSDILLKDEALRKLDRAKRFALPVNENKVQDLTQEQISNLYRDLGIDKENERHYRFNTIHMRGTENMSTEDVFQYFDSCSPSHIEWINDVSCNVVWLDDISAARALYKLTKRIKNLDKVHLNADPFEKELKVAESDIEEMCDDDSVDARQIKTAIPPGFWRIGVPTEKSPFVLLRYATRSDKKQRNAERNSEYYRKHGNPHYGNVPGIFTKSLRNGVKKFKNRVHDGSRIGSDTEERPELINDNKNPWTELAYEWGKADKTEEGHYNFVRSRIAPRTRSPPIKTGVLDLRHSLRNRKESRKRFHIEDNFESSQHSSDKDPWESRIKMPRMKMYADDEEKKIIRNSERRSQRNKPIRVPVRDLRSKINRKKDRPRFKFRVEKKRPVESSTSESSNSEVEYDDGDSGEWALEEYRDLRDSLGRNKLKEHKSFKVTKYQSESEHSDVIDENDEDIYLGNFGHRSPLQIEIDNDEYYQNK